MLSHHCVAVSQVSCKKVNTLSDQVDSKIPSYIKDKWLSKSELHVIVEFSDHNINIDSHHQAIVFQNQRDIDLSEFRIFQVDQFTIFVIVLVLFHDISTTGKLLMRPFWSIVIWRDHVSDKYHEFIQILLDQVFISMTQVQVASQFDVTKILLITWNAFSIAVSIVNA